MKKLLIITGLSIGMLSSICAMNMGPYQDLHETMKDIVQKQRDLIVTKIKQCKDRKELREMLQKAENKIMKTKKKLKEKFADKDFRKKLGNFLAELKETIDEQGKLLRAYKTKKKYENLQKYFEKAKKKYNEIKAQLPPIVQDHIAMVMDMIREKAALIRFYMMKKKEEKKKEAKQPMPKITGMEEEMEMTVIPMPMQ